MIRIKTVKEFIWQIADQFGEQEAYCWRENGGFVTRTYAELNDDVASISRMIHRDFGEEHKAALIGDASYHWMCTFYGVITSANIAVPMDVKLQVNEMTQRIDFADVSIVFLSDRYAYLKDDIQRSCPNVEKILSLEGFLKDASAADIDEVLDIVDPERISVLLYTSGTTGDGLKAAMITQNGLMPGVRDYAPMFRPGDRVLSILPIHHCFELFNGQMKAAYSGCTICINDDISDIIRDLSEFEINAMVAVPAVAKLLCSVIEMNKGKPVEEIKRLIGSNLKRITIGGASASRKMIETLLRAGVKVYNGYGLTESAGGCLFNYKTEEDPDACGTNPYDMDIRIEDGELLLKGSYIMKGYYKQPALTEKVLIDGWLHTGDMAEFTKDGNVVILGRRDNMINLASGEKIYPEKWEDRIMKLGSVSAVMVCEIDEHLAAVIYPALDTEAVRDGIIKNIDAINKTLPGYEKIMDVRFRDVPFPMTSSMKIKRKPAMKEILGQGSSAKSYTMPENDEQAAVMECLKKVIPGADKIGVEDNLYEKGLDSLTTLNLAVLLGCSPMIIYECKTVKEIAGRIHLSREAATPGSDSLMKVPGINDLISKSGKHAGWKKDGAILITGATGYLGSHLIRELAGEHRDIICLVRNESRFIRTCEYYGITVNEKIRTVTGDITKPHFGLDEAGYLKLCKDVRVVFHTAALVSHAGKMEESFEINVKGTEEVIRFCKDSGAQLYHMSSYAVTGFKTDNALTENVLDIGQQITLNPYVQTKYQAEECVLLAREKGVDSTIFRIGNLTERSFDGLFQINPDTNGRSAQLRAFDRLGVYPESMKDVIYDSTPVDKAAKAVAILAKERGTGHIWHVVSPDIKNIKQMTEAAQVPDDEFFKVLTDNIEDKDVAMLSIYYGMNREGFNPNIDISRTVDELSKLGFEFLS